MSITIYIVSAILVFIFSGLLARGMGAGAYQSMEQAGIRPIVTDISTIDDAVRAYLSGEILDHTERLH